jgi:hypothetical protein
VVKLPPQTDLVLQFDRPHRPPLHTIRI